MTTTTPFSISRLGPTAAGVSTAGIPERGDFLCLSCGYGVSIWRALPECPMCGAAEWAGTGARAYRAYR